MCAASYNCAHVRLGVDRRSRSRGLKAGLERRREQARPRGEEMQSVTLTRFVPRHVSMRDDQLLKLKLFLGNSERLFVLTGAGVSTESGVQDYRSNKVGLYATTTHRPTTISDFLRSTKVLMLQSTKRLFHSCVLHRAAMNLRSVVDKLETVVSPTRAESWDNVGLLVEPSGNPVISHILLTIDLTEEVLDEAEAMHTDLIVSYHPPIFKPFKRLTQRSVKERIIIRAVESRMAVYSPHTALDSMEGGVNDWLLSGLGSGIVQTLTVNSLAPSPSKKVSLCGVEEHIIDNIATSLDAKLMKGPSYGSLCDVQFLSTESKLASILLLLSSKVPAKQISLESMPPIPVCGGGRKLKLDRAVTLSELVERVKSHLCLSHVRVARPPSWSEDCMVETVAACAGSGGSVLAGTKADVFLTGELGHHDVLAATASGVAVILCEHTNTERGFLSSYCSLLQTSLGADITIALAKADSDPLVIV